jgi:YVTN family beta-propeller protein
MPHGSRLTTDGSKHYSTCMMDEILIEIDTRTFAVSRHFMLSKGGEHGMAGPPGRMAGHSGNDMGATSSTSATCSPTWAAPSPDGRRVYVACNKSNDIVEIDATTWKLARRIPAGDGVYNLGVTRDGSRLIATNKRGQSLSVIDVAGGRELARIATTRPVVHGVAISPDDRYAFISIEGVGSAPGTVDIIDLRALRKVASVDVGQMAGGIDFWRMEPGPAR